MYAGLLRCDSSRSASVAGKIHERFEPKKKSDVDSRGSLESAAHGLRSSVESEMKTVAAVPPLAHRRILCFVDIVLCHVVFYGLPARADLVLCHVLFYGWQVRAARHRETGAWYRVRSGCVRKRTKVRARFAPTSS